MGPRTFLLLRMGRASGRIVSMRGKFQHLKPGDLITADLINSVLDALNSLDARLAAAEKRLANLAGSGPPPRRPTKRKRKTRGED